ncbi:hypothetical protein D3C72_1034030 [compost metagenome]
MGNVEVQVQRLRPGAGRGRAQAEQGVERVIVVVGSVAARTVVRRAPFFIPGPYPGLDGITRRVVLASHDFGHVFVQPDAMRLAPVPHDQITFEQVAAVVAAGADGHDRAGGVKGDIVDRKVQVVEGGEGSERIAPVQRHAIAQRAAAVRGARTGMRQQRERRRDGRHVARRVEEHAADLAAAA